MSNGKDVSEIYITMLCFISCRPNLDNNIGENNNCLAESEGNSDIQLLQRPAM